MLDFLAIGDAGIDTLVDLHDANVHCEVNKTQCELTLRYADKILVEGMTSKTAYNGMNAAVGAARLGLRTALFAMVGGDASGQRILDALKKERVVTASVKVEKHLRTNASVVLNFQGERTILVYHENFYYRLGKVPAVKWIYLTTMGPRYPVVYMAVATHVGKGRAKLAFNPGSVQLKAGVKKLKPVLEQTSVLFLNKEEAQSMTGLAEVDVRKLLRGMCKLGPLMAVLTDGSKGSFSYDGNKFFHMPVMPATVVERTGCGDAFATACTSALCLGYGIADGLRWGSVNAAGVLESIGPQDGLLTRAELQKTLRRHSKVKPLVM